jgi:hypothetical protein
VGLVFSCVPLDGAPCIPKPATPVALARKALVEAARAAEVTWWPAAQYLVNPPQDYRSAAHSIPVLQNFIEGQDEAGSLGNLFVRFLEGGSPLPCVTSARLDALKAVTQNAAALHQFLSTPATQQAFVKANGADALEDVKFNALCAYGIAKDAHWDLVRQIVGHAIVQIQNPFLKSDPKFADPWDLAASVADFAAAQAQNPALQHMPPVSDPSQLLPQLNQQLSLHERVLSSAPALSWGGPMQNTPLTMPACLGWNFWRDQALQWVARLPSAQMAAELQALKDP